MMMKYTRLSAIAGIVLGSGVAFAGSWSGWESCVNDELISKRVKSTTLSSDRCSWSWQLRNDYSETVDIEYMYSFSGGEKKFDHRALMIDPGETSEAGTSGPCSTFFVDARAARKR